MCNVLRHQDPRNFDAIIFFWWRKKTKPNTVDKALMMMIKKMKNPILNYNLTLAAHKIIKYGRMHI